MAEISVELVDSMGDDLRVANVARVSFNKWKEEFDNKDASLIDYLAAHEHSSPFRHTAITLRCGVPLFLSRQLAKHQAGLSWNEVSRRYVDAGVEFFVPANWRSRPSDGIKQGSGDVSEYSHYISDLYRRLLTKIDGVYSELLQHDIAPEMARMVLPQSMMVNYIWTGNLLSFFHVYRLRAGDGAQEEARDFAAKLKAVVEPRFPHSWKALEDNAKAH